MSKRTGPTRIPVFGSRPPAPGQPPTEDAKVSSSEESNFVGEISYKDIGRKVRIAEKEGVLRFVGKVHFTEGVWCGIELTTANGKNDGCVRGVRYFACPHSRGLMAPLCKVLLTDDLEFEKNEDTHSGPHSMLFGIKERTLSNDLQRIDKNQPFVDSTDNVNVQEIIPKSLIKSETYENLNKTVTKSLVRTNTCDKEIEQKSCLKNDDLGDLDSVENLTYLNENNFPDIVNSTRILNKTENISSESLDDNNALNQTVVYNSITTALEGLTDSTPIVSKASSSSDETDIYYVGSKNKKFYTSEIDQKPSKHRTKQDSNKNLNETFLLNQTIKPLQGEPQLIHPTSLFIESDVEHSPRRRRVKASSFSPLNEDDNNKRDSLEFEESSLGILTPEQMTDLSGFPGSRTPSSENIGSLPNDFQNFVSKFQTELKPPDLPSPNLVDASISLGIIDENMLLSLAIKSDTTTNMELPLDSVGKSKPYIATRLEQTPSPEDLPLDPTPVIECESKTEPTKSKTSNSFITSITSITSLDTGYQGDGEMSRPASRGADHSPLARRPSQRPQPRRPDPLTDSDFYTESDADNHEEHPLRGDRLARVIDGTLYGVDPQAAADIYVNNRENMDSSGIFTDIESNTRTDELSSAENENLDVSPSPSDTSSKTLSNDSQNNAPVIISTVGTKTGSAVKHANNNNSHVPDKVETKNNELNKKRKSPTPSSSASSPASVRSPRHVAREDFSKKYKMPKRNVASKVKAALENTSQPLKDVQITPKKPVGRWDAVMNKITKNTNSLKEIKSKVFTNNTPNTTVRQNATPNTKLRRARTRTDTVVTKIGNIESLHSSASDLSSASPAKRIGSGKKRAEVIRVTQVLTTAKLSPRNLHKVNTSPENKTNTSKPNTETKSQPRIRVFPPKEKKPSTATLDTKDCSRSTVKGGRASPGARPPQQNRVTTAPITRTTEALAVLVQHLVFNLEAFQTPYLKKQIEKSRFIAEEAQFSCRQMEENVKQIRTDHIRLFEEERSKHRQIVDEIIDQHKEEISQLNHKHTTFEQNLKCEYEIYKKELSEIHNDQLNIVKAELQKNHVQALDILREENDSIREEIDEKKSMIVKLEIYKKENDKLHKELKLLNDEIDNLKLENAKMMSFVAEGKENKLQIVLAEVESLRAVLDLKQNQVAELRKVLVEANQKAELLPSATDKISILTARCEDLESQLESKSVFEAQLLGENKKLQESLTNELNQSIRLRQHNEELQWKVQQNKEVVSRVIEETAFNRALLNSSFNEHHVPNRQLERTFSFRERSSTNKNCNSLEGSVRSRKSKNCSDLSCEELSPPSSPKVKGVVEKSDSVSYVLEMEESPEMIANRIVRRSFRNSTPPKTTPTKSPANKRPRIKNSPLSLSASTSSIVPTLNSRTDVSRSRSVSVRNDDLGSANSIPDEVFTWHVSVTSTPKKCPNGKFRDNTFCDHTNFKYEHIDLDDFNDEDIKLPALPSEIGRNAVVQSLSVPKHLAGEAMVSESNSEDESSASSSSGQL
ncbi:hypothetical protein FQR65_LT07479 [Abscondita terminalis]|nr:hypothetical protein FQR65_LT07479 [Abscondita terminalis]